MGGGHPTSGDRTGHPPLGEDFPAGLVVVTGVQVHHRLGGQRADPSDGVQGRQQPVVAVVGWGGHRGQRHAIGLDGDRALEALLAAVDRARAGGLAAAGCLGGAAVHRQVVQAQAEQVVVGGLYSSRRS
jgi:hypothetical protein